MSGLLLSFHWGVVFVLLLAAVPGIIVRLKFTDKMYRWQRGRTSADRRSWYFKQVLTEDRYAKEIRLFDLGTLFSGWFRRDREQLIRERLHIATRRSVAELITEASSTVAVFGSFAFIAYRTLSGSITLGDLVMYYMAFQRAQGFLWTMLRGLAGLYEDTLLIGDFYEFLEVKPKITDLPHPKPVPDPLRQGIKLEQISFRYPDGTRPVLRDISLTIRSGEHIALVGENGSGKTTLVKLLCRLYDPDQGRITLDNTDMRECRLTELRRQISVVPQDFARYQLTARQNIWLGNIDRPPDEQKIITAARLSGADAFIRSLPQGYDTLLGRQFEEGEELSLGQWQKIALARAFLRDAQILILDEPTSALDAKAEFDLFARYRELARGRTAVLISHRLSTVRTADTIYVLEKGRIVEQGDHDKLMRLKGIYAQLFEKQARQYR
ncbi:ABC transporter ATP-binding protein [Candidatus Electrothrix sp.]|uniref:ABC transporter ATP-binding protein n=1 Tax=Candidatus Electrothrix sp. TaxID=2170559 RepID=UPI00405602CB